MNTYWYLWVAAMCVTGFLFWLALSIWLESTEARAMRRQDAWEEYEQWERERQ